MEPSYAFPLQNRRQRSHNYPQLSAGQPRKDHLSINTYALKHTDSEETPSPPLNLKAVGFQLAVSWWFWELAAAILSLCAVVMICGVLIASDQKPLPKLPRGITLNALISFLATVAKSALMVPVAAAISQDKWLWFLKKSCPLNVIDTFNDASRGPFGSLTMLMSRCGGVTTWVAAVVTICAVGFEPFLQQLVSFPARSVVMDGELASILAPAAYNESVIGNLGGADLQLSALIGCFGGAAGAVPDPVCPGGNCAWPGYNSLSLCTQCTDVTNSVSISGAEYDVNIATFVQDRKNRNETSDLQQTYTSTYTIPNGRSVDGTIYLSLINSNTQFSVEYPRRIVWPLNMEGGPFAYEWVYSWTQQKYANIDNPLLAIGYLDLDLNSDGSKLEMKQAMECALTPCVHELRSTMAGGKLTSNLVATDYGSVSINSSGPYPTAGWTASVNGTDFSIIDHGVGNAQGWATLVIQSLRVALEGNTTYAISANCDSSYNDCTSYPSTGFNMLGGPWSSSGQQAIDGTGNFTATVEGVAAAMTGRFQQLGGREIAGQVMQIQTFVNVRWLWVIYPATLVGLGILALLTSMVRTRIAGMAVWKSSELPLASRCVGGRGGDHGVGRLGWVATGPRPDSLTSLDEVAGAVQARLVREEDESGVSIWVLRGTRTMYSMTN